MKRSMAVAAAVALFVAGCGSGGGAASSRDGADSAGEPIKLHQITSTQSQVISLPFTESSARAAVAEINAAGGIDGRPLELTTCNEAADPATATKCAQSAVQDPDVVALVGNFSLFGAQLNPLYEAAGIANVGLDAVVPEDGSSPNNFLMDSGVPGYFAWPELAKRYMNATKVATFIPDTASSAALEQYFEAGAADAGIEIVKKILIPAEAGDFTQYVAQAADAGATVILSAQTSPFNLAMWMAVQASGTGLTTIVADGGVSQSLIDEAGPAATADSYISSSLPPVAEDNPTAEAYRASMAAHAPDEEVISGIGMRSWLAVQLFAEVAGSIEGEIDRASVLATFQGTTGLDFYWINGLDFTANGPLADYPRITQTTVFPIRITDGQQVPVDPFDPYA